jgi:hypothetical protein
MASRVRIAWRTAVRPTRTGHIGGEWFTSTVFRMSDYTIPEPEPKEIDEKLAIELGHMVENNVLRGHPSGEEKCENCRYYLESYKDLSYCWHPKLRILVGGDWWCQWWEAIPEDHT